MGRSIGKFLISNEFILFILAFVILKSFGPPLFADPDVGWHIKAGEVIVDRLNIPLYDIWSYSADQQWFNISWAWDGVNSLLVKCFGLEGLHTICVLLFSLLLVFLYKSLDLRAGITKDAKNVAIAISGLVLWDLMYMRPQLGSYFLMLIMHMALHKSRQDNGKHILYIVPISMIIWANIHGSFLVGYTLLFAYIVEACYTYKAQWLKSLILTTVLSITAIAANPIGFHMLEGVLRTFDSSVYSFIYEWRPFSFGAQYGFSMLIIAFILISNVKNERIPVADKILTFGWLLASLMAIRSFGILAVLALPYIAINLSENLPKSKYTLTFTPKVRVALLAVIFIASIALLPNLKHKIYYDRKAPIEEIEFVKKRYPGKRFFNDYNIGGYIVYFGDGKFRHFIDGRAGTAYSEEVVKSYLDFHEAKPGWHKLFKKYPADGAIISKYLLKNAEVKDFFKKWRKVYEGDVANVYIKR